MNRDTNHFPSQYGNNKKDRWKVEAIKLATNDECITCIELTLQSRSKNFEVDRERIHTTSITQHTYILCRAQI